MKLSDFTNLYGQFIKPQARGSFCPAWGSLPAVQVIRKSSRSIRLRTYREKLHRAKLGTVAACRGFHFPCCQRDGNQSTPCL